MSIAPALCEIVTDCENTHDEVTLSCIDDDAAHLYYRFNVPQGMQNIVLDEWAKADDIRTYTDKYMRLNQTENDLLKCVKQLRSERQISPHTRDLEADKAGRSSQVLRITQGGSEFRSPTVVNSGSVFQGNFAGFERGLFGGEGSN